MHAQSRGSYRARRLLAVAGLVVFGLVLALPFRLRPRSPGHGSVADAGVVDVPLRCPDVKLEIGPPGAVSPADPLPTGDESLEFSQPATRPDLASIPLPELAGNYGPLASSTHPIPRRDWKPVRLKLPDARPKERRHRLTDGDTLERLAERYLGGASRAPEIYAINRDLLAAPDVLPLGKIIRIPPADEPATSEQVFAEGASTE